MVLALALSLAVGPSPAWTLDSRDQAVAGAVSPEQWRVHTLLHLQHLNGHFSVPDITPYLFKPGSPLIFSTLGCDSPTMVAALRMTVAVPEAPACEIAALEVVERTNDLPGVVDHSPPIDVLHPPPETRSF